MAWDKVRSLILTYLRQHEQKTNMEPPKRTVYTCPRQTLLGLLF